MQTIALQRYLKTLVWLYENICISIHFSSPLFYLFVDLSITLLLIFLTDDLPRSQTVPMWEPSCCVLEHLIQGVQPRLQWCHQLLNGAHRPVGSLRMSHQRACLRPPGSILLWAIDAPIFWCGDPAEDAGRQEGDEGVDGHGAAEEEQQPRVQVLLQLHLARTAAGEKPTGSNDESGVKKRVGHSLPLSLLLLFLHWK